MKFSAKQFAIALIETAEQNNDPSATAKSLVALLAQRGELNKAREIINAVEQVWKEKYGAATVTIHSAYGLSDAFKNRLSELAPGAELREYIESSLIGGARVRVDDRVVDGTVAGHLEQLRYHLGK